MTADGWMVKLCICYAYMYKGNNIVMKKRVLKIQGQTCLNIRIQLISILTFKDVYPLSCWTYSNLNLIITTTYSAFIHNDKNHRCEEVIINTLVEH